MAWRWLVIACDGVELPLIAPAGLLAQLERAHSRAAEEREKVAEREAEMRYEMDRLRATKRELEGKLAGVDVRQLSQEHEGIRQAEGRRREAEDAHKKEVGALQAKLQWYTENQQLIDEIEAQRQAAEVRAPPPRLARALPSPYHSQLASSCPQPPRLSSTARLSFTARLASQLSSHSQFATLIHRRARLCSRSSCKAAASARRPAAAAWGPPPLAARACPTPSASAFSRSRWPPRSP